MTDKALRRRTRQWTKTSVPSFRYGPFARLSDWWCAGRDGRKGLPALPDDNGRRGAPVELSTPRMMLLGQLGLGRIEKEWIIYQAEVANHEATLRDSTARREALDKQLAEAKAQITKTEETPVDLTTKVAGEERTSQAIVEQRRVRDQAVVKQRQQDAAQRLTAQAETIDVEIAHLQEQISIRLRVAQRRAAMIEAYIRRRCAAYLTRLVRRHPDGLRLNELMRPRWPDKADWARANGGPDADTDATLAGVPAGVLGVGAR
jgi:hypothetical protein